MIVTHNGHLKVAVLVLLLLLGGCASTPQSDFLLANLPKNIAHKKELNDVVFFPQEAYQCGPASLAMMLQAHQPDIKPEQLTAEVFVPELKGSLQPELIAATRRHGLIPYVLNPELNEIVQEVAHQRPVLILQNLGLSIFPQWHYAVVVGYDLQEQTLILRSGVEARHEVGMRTFERTWQRGKHWAMITLLPGQLPVQPEEWRYVQAIVGFEKIKRFDLLLPSYQTGLKKWPGSVDLRMGMGNLLYQQGDKQGARQYYQDVINTHPEYASAHNNLAQVLADLNELTQALLHAQQAVKLGGVHAAIYQSTLNEIQLRLTTP